MTQEALLIFLNLTAIVASSIATVLSSTMILREVKRR